MKAEDIALFLRGHPQFFDQHPELLEKIHVPHPHGGRAIPLAERQTLALRENVRSVALVPLGQKGEVGLLALGSEDAKRFFPEMGTLYLRRIGELCAAGVTARL